MPTINEINIEIMQGNFTNDQLNAIGQAIKFRRRQIGRDLKVSIRVGDTVKFYHPKLGQDLHQTLALCKHGVILVNTARGMYNVPANLLERI